MKHSYTTPKTPHTYRDAPDRQKNCTSFAMSSLFRNRYKPGENKDQSASTVESVTASGNIQVTDGDLKYIGEQGGNNAPVAYQEVSGAPVETHSPLGYNVGPVTIVFLNLSKMVGTGV